MTAASPDHFSDRVEQVADDLLQAFTQLTADLEASEVTGLGVITDVSDFTLCPAANGHVHLESQTERLAALGPQDPEIAARKCRWNPGEWELFCSPGDFGGLPALTDLARVASEQARTDADATLTSWCQTLAAAMALLHSRGDLDGWPQAVRVLNVVDLDLDEAPFPEWMRAMNHPDRAADYETFTELYR